MRSDRPDIEVTFDLPTDAFGPCHQVTGDLDAEVQRMRSAVALGAIDHDRRHGSAADALELLAVHRTAPAGALLSALLVCTHRRFERCSRTLMTRLEADDLLGPDDLDRLAWMLLGEDRVRFAIPSSWLGTGVDVPPGVRVRSSGHELTPPREDEQTFPHRQNIPAAARRWAVRRLLEAGHLDVDTALTRIAQLRDGAAGAALSGVLDAWESCPPDDLQRALEVALGANLASVRRRALDVLALTGRRDEAQAHARDDGAAAVRAWQPPADAASRTPAQPTLLDAEG